MNQDLVASINRPAPQAHATLDMDATLKTVYQDNALHCHKGHKA